MWSILRFVLIVKIVGTILLFCLPLLFLSAESLAACYGFRPAPMLMARLVGAAYAALIVGYWAGLREARRGVFPAWTVGMGIVSNAGGVLCAGWAFAVGDVALSELKPLAFVAIGFAAAVAASLILCGLTCRRRAAA